MHDTQSPASTYTQVYRDGSIEAVDTTQWYPKIMRRDYKVGLNVTETAVDDPDPVFYENYVCGTQRNYTGYCNPEVDKMVDSQSMQSNVEKRKRMVWDIEKKLAEDDARPTIIKAAPNSEPVARYDPMPSRIAPNWPDFRWGHTGWRGRGPSLSRLPWQMCRS